MSRRIAIVSWAAGVGLIAGCGQPATSSTTAPTTPEPSETKTAPVPITPPANSNSPVSTTVPQPPSVPPPSAFVYPLDTGGKKIAAVLTPNATLAPIAVGGAGPRSRTSAIDRGDLPLPKVAMNVPTIPIPPGKPVRPSAPVEQIPADLGQAAAENPVLIKLAEKPLLRATGAANPGAGDVPLLARLTTDRAAVEDPTVDIATQRAVNTPLPAPFLTVWFVRFSIPDPFEFTEQLKGKIGTDTELGTSPVIVSPGK